jgi:putative PIN family toxin of toxin-antitoxin system
MPGKSVRVFLDSNVLISGLFSDRGAPRLILDILSLNLPVLKAVTGAFNVAEVERNLKAKLPAALPLFQSFLSIAGPEIVPMPTGKDLAPLAGLTDAKDLPVLASAIAGQADVLVTGDKKDLLRIRKGALPFPILLPADFLDSYLPRFLKSGF